VPGYYSIGIRTYTSSIATVAPKLSIKLHELAAGGRGDELMKLMHECVIPLYALRARRKGYEVSAMKAMMDEVGLKGGPSRPPLVEVREAEREELRAMLEAWRPFL
jgi:5-dehydro-4-deoxyglucarate dehydratase